jgi:hypothetical protein
MGDLQIAQFDILGCKSPRSGCIAGHPSPPSISIARQTL